MKIVFYRTLLKRARNLTPNERILYSFLAAKSITRLEQVFDVDGEKINEENLKDIIREGKERCELCEINNSKLARELHQTRKTIIEGKKHLKEHKYIGNNWIYISEELLEHGYFELVNADKLRGELLIFYSYLLNKAKKYEYRIDTYKYKIAEQIGKSEIAVTDMLNRLYRKGLAERMKDGKLLIKQI